MSAVRRWLETLGLSQYADAFEANDIDVELLGQIDDQALRELGMSSTGRRLRLRNAIASWARPQACASQSEDRVPNALGGPEA